MTNNFEDETNSARPLTARSPSKDMRAHALAFLAIQNGEVWMQDEQYTYNRKKISEIIIACSMKPGLKIKSVKSYGKDVARLMRANGGRIKLWAAHDLLANALGYKSYKRAYELRGVDDFVPNLWPLGVPRGEQLLKIDGGWPSEKQSEEFSWRKAFNARRAQAVKLTEVQRKQKKRIARPAGRSESGLSDSAES